MCIIRSTGKEITKSTDRFEEEWSGTALAFENIDDAGEPDYKAKRKEEIRKKIFKSLVVCSMTVLLLILTCFAWSADGSLSLLPKLLLFFSNAAGCYVSYLLVRQDKHQSNALTEKFCKAGKYIDCRKVTDSKYSTLFGVVTLAETGAAFFSSMLLWVAVAPLGDNWLQPLWWFSILVLPFTLWSLVVQAFVIRKWCLFCCTVVFLLWSNAAILLAFYPRPAMMTIPEAAMLMLLLIVSTVAIMEAKKTIGSKERKYAQQRDTAKIKYSATTMLFQLAKKADVTDNLGFTFGNPDSHHSIDLYVSIACSHCRNAVRGV